MSAAPVQLQWAPISPSWLVSIGIVVFAVLPHKIPLIGIQMLTHTTTRLLLAAAAAYIWVLKPVLGTALFILLASCMILPNVESFSSDLVNLIYDSVPRNPTQKRWLVEDVLVENPRGIQERTGETNINYDEVPEEGAIWESERIMDEHPTAIQDKPVPSATENDIWH